MILSQPSPPPTPEAPELTLFAQWVQRQLLSVSVSIGPDFAVQRGARVFRIRDDDFTEAFALVPESHGLAVLARDAFVTGQRLQFAGLLTACLAPAALLVASLGPATLLLPLLVAGLAASSVGLALTLIALPFMITAQQQFFAALASYNHGLLELRPPPVVSAGGLILRLPP
jgi:hypothetical protein